MPEAATLPLVGKISPTFSGPLLPPPSESFGAPQATAPAASAPATTVVASA